MPDWSCYSSAMRLRHLGAACLTTAALIFLIRSRGVSKVGNALREVKECETDMNDYKSIDSMFDEVILEPRSIVYWTTFYGSHDFGFGLGQIPTFMEHKCEVANCVISANKSAVAQADAVIFHLIDHLKAPKKPPIRTANQRYVFYFMEPPQKMDDTLMAALKTYNGFFNVTMTYKIDSDVYNPANAFVRRRNPLPKMVEKTRQALHGKSKMVVWFAECDESALAKAYVEELQKYISLDIYGPCGKLRCGLSQSSTCWDMVERDYRFYLSVERFMCQDYITERSFRALQYNVLPIVYSGGNYSRSMPPNSVIDIFDYPSPKQLAEYLVKLSKFEGAFMWHMEWKKDWEFRGWGHGFCDLCKMINNPKHPSSTVHNLPAFLTRAQCGKDYLSHFKKHWEAGNPLKTKDELIPQ